MNEHDAPGQPGIRPIPQRRVIDKLDEYMSRRDYAGAERHLNYWLAEARQGGDLRGELTVRNELIGHYRKTGEREKAIENVDAALALLDRLDYGGAISAGTTCVNAATALSAFGENERALALFERARPIYESSAHTQPRLLGGLYNNMALACAALRRWDEAIALYEKAMARMEMVEGGALEQAITCLNMADLIASRDGMECGEARIDALLERAAGLLDGFAAPRDGYYAFVCEKCAPTFDYYGWFAEAEKLKGEAERIYAGA
ncbi:MAG: tetratricopeptide repeat protein [Clostridia bacterium]|nr:tetratricopeptide repeat protein [Clostridia bacterium]